MRTPRKKQVIISLQTSGCLSVKKKLLFSLLLLLADSWIKLCFFFANNTLIFGLRVHFWLVGRLLFMLAQIENSFWFTINYSTINKSLTKYGGKFNINNICIAFDC